MSCVSRFSYLKYSYVCAILTAYLKTSTGEKDVCSLVTLWSIVLWSLPFFFFYLLSGSLLSHNSPVQFLGSISVALYPPVFALPGSGTNRGHPCFWKLESTVSFDVRKANSHEMWGLRASSVISLPLGFRIDGLFPRRKNSACKSFYQYVLVPLSSNRHKLGRQNTQDGSSVKKKKVCLMSMES